MEFLTEEFVVDPTAFPGPVLVTGAGGCIGAWVLAVLRASGVPCVAFDLEDSRRRPGLVMGEAGAAQIPWETGDVTEYERLHRIVSTHGVGAIIHLAGLQVPFCAANPALGARVNVEGTINVLEVARQIGIRRTVYASSVAAHGMPPGGRHRATLYGAYKAANEHTAAVYWQDWQVPSVGIRPNIVYGVGRDQGISAKCTLAIHAAIAGEPFEVPYRGPTSFLYAGEAAAGFIAAVARDGEGATVFDLNGACEDVEDCIALIEQLVPGAQLSASGAPFPFPPDLSDEPIRAHLGDFPAIGMDAGIRQTHRAFLRLRSEGRLGPVPT
jgi:nucleoside-diphosphate-sugar epimerase